MKKSIPPVAIAVIAVVVVGGLVVLGVRAGGSGGPAPTTQDTKAMNEFRDANAAKTGGTIDESSGQMVQPIGEQRTSEQMAREGGQ